MNEYLTLTQLAKKTGYSTQYLRALVSVGKIPAVKIGQAWCVASTDAAKIGRKPWKEC